MTLLVSFTQFNVTKYLTKKEVGIPDKKGTRKNKPAYTSKKNTCKKREKNENNKRRKNGQHRSMKYFIDNHVYAKSNSSVSQLDEHLRVGASIPSSLNGTSKESSRMS